MKISFFFFLFVGVAYSNEVARISSSTGPISVFRNFEQIFLSKNSRVLRKDLVKIDEGVLELSSGESKILLEGPASLQLQRKNRHVELTLHKGRILLNCEKGEGWELRYGEFKISGTGGMFHAIAEGDGLEVACLDGAKVMFSLNETKGGFLEKGMAGRLDLSSNRLQYPRTLNAFESQVYRDSLVSSVVHAGEKLLDLDGKPFAPLRELWSQELKRRSLLLADSSTRAAKTAVRAQVMGRLEDEFEKNLEEAVDEGVGFSFPAPLSPIPSP